MKYITTTLLLATLLAVSSSCRNDEYIAEDTYKYVDTNDDDPYDEEQVDIDEYPCWTAETHGNGIDPNFDVVFPDVAQVSRIDLTISSSNLSAMKSDLYDLLYGSSSSSGFGNNMMGGGISDNDVDGTPMWVPCTVEFEGKEWYQVGVRYKGNSSLSKAYGDTKLSLKLDFDQYEDQYPALTNQRFYGFKQLNLNNNYDDNSLMREKVVSDLFRDFGVPAAHTCFCEVYVNGSLYGLYTIVEEVDDTVIKYQFDDNGVGNTYKPEISVSKSSYSTSELYLKTNTESPDYSDADALYTILNSSTRTSNEASWCADLEGVFDVDMFMKWLAANTTIQNWDTYAQMAHNFYLDNYQGVLTWIPWDNNEALNNGTTTYSPSEIISKVSSSWPLINYLVDVEEYEDTLDGYYREFIDGVFDSDRMVAIYESYSTLLYSYASAEASAKTSFLTSISSFNSAVTTLKTHVSSRYTVVESYLNSK